MSPAKAKARSYRALLKARLRDTSVTIEARALWAVIETFANTDGSNAFPSVPTLAALCRHNVKWVEKYLRELKAAEWLFVGKRPKRGGGFSNVYSLHSPQNWGDVIPPDLWVVHHPQKGGKTGYQTTGAASSAVSADHEEADAIASLERNGSAPH